MAIKFTGYLSAVSNDGSKHNKDMTIMIRIFGAKSGLLERELWDTLEAGQPLEVTLGEEESKPELPYTIKENGYGTIQARSLGSLHDQVTDYQLKGWSCIGASYWHDNLVFQTMVRRIQ